MAFIRIDSKEAQRLIDDESAAVVDIRDRVSFESGRIKNADHIDNESVLTWIETANKDLPIIVCCYHGNMSQGAAEYLNQNGFEKSYSLDG
ncbi:MAG: thiosulfate sulfurtransferase GlpE, partial [Pseudomonadota bacterium]